MHFSWRQIFPEDEARAVVLDSVRRLQEQDLAVETKALIYFAWTIFKVKGKRASTKVCLRGSRISYSGIAGVKWISWHWKGASFSILYYNILISHFIVDILKTSSAQMAQLFINYLPYVENFQIYKHTAYNNGLRMHRASTIPTKCWWQR